MNIELVKGDDKVFELTFVKNGVPVDITEWTIYFMVKERIYLEDTEAILAKVIDEHSDPTNGKTQLTITHDESVLLSDISVFDIRAKDDEGQVMTLLIGRIYATKSVRRSVP